MKSIFTRIPVNKTAAKVVGIGEHYKPNKIVQTADSDTPIPIDDWKKCDLKGARRGRFTVLGMARDQKGRLVVKCDCGRYSIRTAKAMKNENNNQDRCEHCRHLLYLKRKDIFRRTGKDIDILD